jgi:hypothetical protein
MVYGTQDISSIPQVWAMYKEVMGYFADGMTVPDDGMSLFGPVLMTSNRAIGGGQLGKLGSGLALG